MKSTKAWGSICLLAAAMGAVTVSAADKPADMTKPVKVFILLGQSNMVGMGAVSGDSVRWGKEFLEPVVSIYQGTYSPTADYDKLTPIETKKLESFGGEAPTPFPSGGTAVVRGSIQMATDGSYVFRPGYQASEFNIMEIDGKEVYRRETGKDAVSTPFKFAKGSKHPFRITFLTEVANGLGWSWRTDSPGNLSTLVHTDGKFQYLADAQGKWAVRNDVRCAMVTCNQHCDWLQPGFGAAGKIGPELGFGHVVGNLIDAPVLLVKACIGNRGLAWDLLPPGSKRFVEDGKVYAGYKDKPDSWNADPVKGVATEPPPWLDKKGNPINWYAGKQYDEDIANAKAALADIGKSYPGATKYEVAGFVFWQGEKDDGNAVHAAHYEQNLVNFIKAVRKEFSAPDAKFVLATLGEAVKGSGNKVLEAHLAVDGNSGKHPEFKGNVATVYTNPMAQGGGGNGHYGGKAEVYMDVGEAMGKAMVELLKK